jgi:hypothetical protein
LRASLWPGCSAVLRTHARKPRARQRKVPAPGWADWRALHQVQPWVRQSPGPPGQLSAPRSAAVPGGSCRGSGRKDGRREVRPNRSATAECKYRVGNGRGLVPRPLFIQFVRAAASRKRSLRGLPAYRRLPPRPPSLLLFGVKPLVVFGGGVAGDVVPPAPPVAPLSAEIGGRRGGGPSCTRQFSGFAFRSEQAASA